ncbi:serine hydrolase domain-containing protein [Rhizobium sp.]|jgi:methyl acetate hydrolase|uniref:serine hydrolase domain-containing protein n=1 Tax=Rhizobium sp. TaxID=391 RepID=UPI000E8E8A41|nr:1,4-butanediol diacrylate esterase [Rhizobium sp.]
MNAIDTLIKDVVDRNDAPFLVAMSANAQGIIWSGSAGMANDQHTADENTIMRVYSMTKAIAATAAMILYERGKLDVDAEVESILPEFSRIQVLDGFDGDTPVLRAPKTKCTIRHLLTHTSGFTYETINPDILKYLQVTGNPAIMDGPLEGLFYPMIADPGTLWSYGIGLDWIGRIIEVLDGRSIDQFCTEEIFQPLGLSDTIFEVDEHQKDRLADVYARKPDGALVPIEFGPPSHPEFYSMGGSLYSTARDYMHFVRLFLNEGTLDGVRLLKPETINWMLENKIGDMLVTPLVNAVGAVGLAFEALPGTRKNHSFGFMRSDEDHPGMRKAGSQGWCGVLNTHYWFDRASNVAGVFMSQMLPLGDPRFQAQCDAFESAVYANIS